MKYTTWGASALLSLCCTMPIQAKVTFPSIIGSNMVLQQQSEVNLWGYAKPQAAVTIQPSWSNQKVSVRADKDGRWKVQLSTPQATFDPQTIAFSDGERVILDNILIGEVWLCSGQSNMEMPLGGFWSCPIEGGNETIALSTADRGIRMAVTPKYGKKEVKEDGRYEWLTANSNNAPKMSAVGYYFAQMLSQSLQVPVGIIANAWGGSRCEGWLPREVVKNYADIDLKAELDDPQEPADGEEWKWHYHTPVIMYNGMLKPAIPFTIKGFLWYQGESNVGHEKDYFERFQTMVQLWRDEWGQGNIPFYLCELAPWADYGTDNVNGAKFREMQQRLPQVIPNCGCITTNDLVYPYEGYQIHPCQKKPVGQRLAYMALNKTYGYHGISCDAPTYKSMEKNDGKIVLTFDHATEGFSPWRGIEGFEIAGSDRVFYPAQVEYNQDNFSLTISAAEVPEPEAVRYCFKNFQLGNLKTPRGLPLVPFRTDNW